MSTDDYPPVKEYLIELCDACIAGEGRECHTPGCALWLHRVDIPIERELLLDPIQYRWSFFNDEELKCIDCDQVASTGRGYELASEARAELERRK